MSETPTMTVVVRNVYDDARETLIRCAESEKRCALAHIESGERERVDLAMHSLQRYKSFLLAADLLEKQDLREIDIAASKPPAPDRDEIPAGPKRKAPLKTGDYDFDHEDY